MNSTVLERYRRVQEKFGLPHLKELKETFKFDIDNDQEIFDQIRHEMSERLFSFTERIIEPIIAGSESICCLFEQNMVTKHDKEVLFELYKKMQVLKWENNLLILKPDEKQTLDWIRKTWDFWNNDLGDELSQMCKKLSDSWKELEFKEAKTNYHG